MEHNLAVRKTLRDYLEEGKLSDPDNDIYFLDDRKFRGFVFRVGVPDDALAGMQKGADVPTLIFFKTWHDFSFAWQPWEAQLNDMLDYREATSEDIENARLAEENVWNSMSERERQEHLTTLEDLFGPQILEEEQKKKKIRVQTTLTYFIEDREYNGNLTLGASEYKYRVKFDIPLIELESLAQQDPKRAEASIHIILKNSAGEEVQLEGQSKGEVLKVLNGGGPAIVRGSDLSGLFSIFAGSRVGTKASYPVELTPELQQLLNEN